MKKLFTALISAAVLAMPLALVATPASAQNAAPSATPGSAATPAKAKKAKPAKKSTKGKAKAKAAKAKQANASTAK